MTSYPYDEDRENMLTVIIPPGKSLSVKFANTDGEFIVAYGDESLTVETNSKDSEGRSGVIYEERFGLPGDGFDYDDEIVCCYDEDVEDDE